MPAAAQSSVLLAMSAPPYWHCGRTVRRQSLMTLAALLPAVIGAVWTWGLPAVRVMSLCVAVAVLTEAACQKLMGRELAIDDYTAVCSGLLLAFMLPADAPWWIAVMAPLIAISLGKMAFGGLGANPVNTSVVGWAVLFVSFPLFMEPNAVQLNAASMVDPLVRLKFFGWADAGRIPLQDLLLGQCRAAQALRVQHFLQTAAVGGSFGPQGHLLGIGQAHSSSSSLRSCLFIFFCWIRVRAYSASLRSSSVMMSMPTQRSMTRSGSALRAAAQKASSARMDGGCEESEGESILSSVALPKAAAFPLVSFTPASTASSFIMSGNALRRHSLEL